MVDDIREIAVYYNRDPELEHTRLAEHQLEYDLTWRILGRCLPPAGRSCNWRGDRRLYAPTAQKRV
jgi:hypothetical protein